MRLHPISDKVLFISAIILISALFAGPLAGTAAAQFMPDRPARSSDRSEVVSGPNANAGPPQMAVVGKTVLLDGSRSISPTGAPLTYKWSFVSVPAGASPALSRVDAVNPRFAVPQDGTYVLELAVSDGERSSTSQVVVSTVSTPPLANAGVNKVVAPGALVHLDGSGSSDPDGDVLKFKWNLSYQPTGSMASISNPTAIAPTFFVDLPGTYVAQLTVTDSHDLSSTATVTIRTQDLAPIAVAGDNQKVAVGNSVHLNASQSSDPNGDAITVAWSILSRPADSVASITAPNTVTPWFVVDAPGSYVLQLAVTDLQGNEAFSTVLITTDPKPPTANAAGKKSVAVGDTVSLSGSASADANGAPLSYRWAVLARPSGSNVTISADLNSPTASFIADQPGEYLVQLIVSNGDYSSAASTALVTTSSSGGHLVLSPNPIAFGSQPVHTTSSPAGLTITNPTDTAVQVLSVLTTGANAGDFNLFNVQLPLNVGPNSAQLVKVLFTPGAAGPRTATYIVNDNSGGLPNTVQLTGTGSEGTAGITLSPAIVPFPDQEINTLSTPIRFTVSNPGDGPLFITALSFGGTNPGDFILPLNFAPPSPTAPLTVPANGSTTIPVVFAPKVVGPRAATLSLADNAAGNPHSVSLSGNGLPGTAGLITVSPASLVFPDQSVGVTSAALTVTVTNAGTTAVQITSLGFTGTNSSDFATTSAAPITVPASGGTATIPVKFTPGATGARAATLTVSDSSGGSSHTVSLSGNGTTTPAGLNVSPLAITFPVQAVNTTSSPVPVTITNNFGSPVTITGMLLLGTNAGDFTTVGIRTPLTLPNGGTATFNVLFTPHADGQRTAAIVVNDDSGGAAHRIELTGNKVGTVPGITLNPTSLTFANQDVGTTSASQSVTVSNPGTAALQITALSFGGTNPVDFVFPTNFTLPTSGAPLTVAAGGSTTIPVSFKPTAAGSRSATLLLTDNATGSPHSVALNGTGTQAQTGVSVAPTSIPFGNQLLSTASAPQNVTVTNFTNAAVQITSLSFTGTNNGDFTTTAVAPITVAASGGTATIPVKFTPAGVGPRSATLTVTDNSGGTSHAVALTGTGFINGGLDVNPAAIIFPTQALNTTSAPVKVTFTNNTVNTVRVDSLLILGTNAGDFSLTGVPTPPDDQGPVFTAYVIPPGGFGTFNVLFTPHAEGIRSAAVLIRDTASTLQYRLELSGNIPGNATATLNPTSLAFADQVINTTSATKSFTVSNSGNIPLQITGLAFGGTNPGDFVFPAGFTPPTSGSPLIVAAGGSTTIAVSFKPTGTGNRAATLSLTDNAAGSPHSVSLNGKGTGTGVTVEPASLTFSDLTVAQVSAAQNVTVTNWTSAAVQITSLTFTGTNSGDFSTTSTAPITVAASGGIATIPVKFTPGATGSRSATLTVIDNSGGTQHTVSLSGKGLPPVVGIVVAPLAIDFQQQTLSTTSAPMAMTISNTSTNVINITTWLLAGSNAGDFTITNSRTPFALNAGETRTLNVLFRPGALGPRSANFIVYDDSGGPSHTVALTGVGATTVPTITWSPISVSFGTQGVGSTSTPSVITFTNNGNGPLLIKGLAFAGTNLDSFAFPASFTPPTPASPISVDANGGTTTISVIFQPKAGGPLSASLAITDNANFSPHSVALSGTGTTPNVALAPNPLVFAAQALGTASAPLNLKITNTGNAELRVTALALVGANAAEFGFAPGFIQPSPASPIIVPALGTANVPLFFAPENEGSRSASLAVTSNAPGSPHSADLRGTGSPSTLSLDPKTGLVFGQQLKGTSSAPLAVTVMNTGTADVQITSLSFTGTNATDFTTPESGPINIPAGGNAILHVVFKPVDIGIRTATLNITDTAPGSPHQLPLSGAGIAPFFTITPTTLDFGVQAISVTSDPKSLLIRNTGSAPLHINSISVTGLNAADFSVDNAGPITIDPDNATATVQVRFKPNSGGIRTATLNFNDDADGAPHTVSLTGSGQTRPVFSISQTSIDFGLVPVNSTSAPQLVTITNTGSADLVVNFVSRVGPNPDQFHYAVLGSLGSSDFPETLPPGGHVDMTVTFAPVNGSGTARSATFVFDDNASDSPQSMQVSGTANTTPAHAQITPTSLTFPQVQQGSSSVPMTVNVKNTGGADLIISSIAFTGAQGSDFSAIPLAPVTIKSGVTTAINVTFTPQSSSPTNRTATLTINSNSDGGHTDTVPVSGTVNGGTTGGIITMPSFSLGGNLEMLATASLSDSTSTALQVTITSLDPSKLLLSPLSSDPNGTAVGVASFTGTVPQGQGKFGIGFPGFWVQALVSSGTAQIEVTAPGWTKATATVTLTHSGFVLNSTQGAGINFTTTIGTDSLLTVSTVQLDSSGNVIGTPQPVRGGTIANIAVTSGTPGTGTVVGSPAVVQPGKTVSSQITFHPVAKGSSLLSIAQPNGFFAPATGASLTATVNTPSIVIISQSIGFDLVAPGSAQLDTPAPTGGVAVTISSSDPSKLSLSTNPNAAGSSSVTLQVAAGSTTIPVFYLQALASSGSVTLTGSGNGYTSGTAPVNLFPSAVVINSPNDGGDFTTTSISPETPLTLSVWQLSNLRPFIAGQLRPGVTLPVTVNSSNTSAGDVTGNPAQFLPGSVVNNDLYFLPAQNCAAPCTTNLIVAQPAGFSTPAQGGQIKVTVNQPKATLRMIVSTVGKNLQVLGSGALDAPSPDNLQVTISSDNPNVLLSTLPNQLGASSITAPISVGAGVNSIGFPNYYVQSLASTGTALLTVSVPGFASSTLQVTLAPSGIVMAGPNGIGVDFGVLRGTNVPLTISAVVLNPGNLQPTQLSQSIRGGTTVSVDVTSSAPSVALIQNSPLILAGGSSGGTITMVPTTPGTATISAPAPAGFSPPSTGGQLNVTVN